MATFEELDKLGSKELHDRAVALAKKHMDLGFFWRLLKDVPAAEAVAGNEREADVDIASAARLVADATESGSGPLAEALRPVFIDYLLEHERG